MITPHRPLLLAAALALSVPLTTPAAPAATAKPRREAASSKAPRLTAGEIVRRHVAARGGVAAWHAVQTMTWRGKMDVGYGDSVARSEQWAGSAQRKGKGPHAAAPAAKRVPRSQVQVPFVLELKRPGKSRVEIEFAGKKAVQVFDGKQGFMLRPFLNREDWVPFTAEQVAQQRRWDLEDPLMEHAAAGTRVELASTGRVGGREAYELKLTRKDGSVQHVWIDAKTFLDVKVEGVPRRMDGKLHTVWVTQRDFRPVKGVMVPFVLETSVDGYPDTHKVVVEKVAMNPRLDDARFTKPRT